LHKNISRKVKYLVARIEIVCNLRDLSLDEIFSLFKRFEVVMGNHIDQIEVNGEDYLDLK